MLLRFTTKKVKQRLKEVRECKKIANHYFTNICNYHSSNLIQRTVIFITPPDRRIKYNIIKLNIRFYITYFICVDFPSNLRLFNNS